MRIDGRTPHALRPVTITPHYLPQAEGSALIEVGATKIICAASVEDSAPPFRRNTGTGWVTAEYSMLPRATTTRTVREVNRGRPSGRTAEIQRLIGRSLRAAVDFARLGERTIIVDCDVVQADGGTRTAAITGGWVALAFALRRLREYKVLTEDPLLGQIAAVSLGVVDGTAMLDLCYEEDSRAEVDMNVVMTAAGEYVEIQATAENRSFASDRLTELLELAKQGVQGLTAAQRQALEQ